MNFVIESEPASRWQENRAIWRDTPWWRLLRYVAPDIEWRLKQRCQMGVSSLTTSKLNYFCVPVPACLNKTTCSDWQMCWKQRRISSFTVPFTDSAVFSPGRCFHAASRHSENWFSYYVSDCIYKISVIVPRCRKTLSWPEDEKRFQEMQSFQIIRLPV